MTNMRCASVVLALAVPALACSSSSEPTAAAGEQNLDSAANTDVQVVRASARDNVMPDGQPLFDKSKCEFTDVVASNPDEGVAKADCTTEIMKAYGLPTINTHTESLAWVRFAPGTTDIASAAFRHWCAKVDVLVAVKAAAWNSPTFEGIGFYTRESVVGVSDGARVFYAKSDPRLVRKGEATLASGEKAYLYELVGAGPCEVNGTGRNPGHDLELKPYVTYAGGYERWESIPSNHSVGYGESWDRSSDLLLQ